MKIGVLGTGMVGDAIGTKLIQLGHQVKMGSRSATNEKSAAWVTKNGAMASQGTFADAAAFGEILFNCTSGVGSLDALRLAGEQSIGSKTLIDVSNPLDFSHGMPPSLTVCNTDSLGEQIQRAFPQARVVKALNTVSATVMVNPGVVAGGDHELFMCGNDPKAKRQVKSLMLDGFGWRRVMDLGDITAARATEMMLPLWVRLMMVQGTPMFNFKIVK